MPLSKKAVIDSPAHPGEIIRREYLGRAGLTVREVADHLDITRKALYDVLNGDTAVSPEMAIRLERAGWGSAEHWLQIQMQHDLWGARQSDGIKGVTPFPTLATQKPTAPEIAASNHCVDTSVFKKLLRLVDRKISDRSGSVFYSGRTAFAKSSDIYLLGLNPGGDPNDADTITLDIAEAKGRKDSAWSAYKDQAWKQGYSEGGMPMQRRVRHLISGLGLDIQSVPASNVVFVRSKREAALKAEKNFLLDTCWPVHEAVIRDLHVRLVLCLGGTAGAWVRQKMGAHKWVGDFEEENDRRWKSWAHKNSDGLHVVTLTHPSIVDWTQPTADPTDFVRRILEGI